MPHYKKLIGRKCYLSPVTLDDADKWAAWDNDLEVALPLGDEAYSSYALERERDAVAGTIKSEGHTFTIVDLSSDEPVGRCMLFNVDHVNRSAMLGIVIGEKTLWGKGYGRDAVSLLLDHAFNLLNLNSVMLGTFSFNRRAIRCYEQAGFQVIGRRREGRIVGAQRFDVVLMDILAAEYTSVAVTRLLQRQGERPVDDATEGSP